ncbi:MAG: methyltransferase C-terminal domain-containing protein, partial [Candidatus Methylomirabilales bacterium]
RRNGLVLTHIEAFPGLHGGTLRWHLTRQGPPSPEVVESLATESDAGLTRFDYYSGFAANVDAIRARLRALLEGLKAEGHSIAAYGAAAKGATLLNTTGIGADLLDFVVDRNPHKQGRFMPGSHLPITGTDALVERRPDYVLLLAWNFADEVMAQQADYRELGGRFICPVPEPRVLP